MWSIKKSIDTTNAVVKEMKSTNISATQLDITWNEFRFITFIWKTKYGWFLYIPNWKVANRISEPTDVTYNKKVLTDELRNEYMAEAISWAVCNYWKGEFQKSVDN